MSVSWLNEEMGKFGYALTRVFMWVIRKRSKLKSFLKFLAGYTILVKQKMVL